MWTENFQMFNRGLEKAEEPENKLPTSTGSWTMPKPLTLWITINCGKFWKRWEYQTTWPVSCEVCVQVTKQQLELDMEQQTGSKSGKEYIHQGCMLSPCLFNFYAEYIMWYTRLDESKAGIKIARRNINNFRYANDTTLRTESREELKTIQWKALA